MTALQLRRQRQRLQAATRRQRAERRGSTLLIVLVLMAMLASLGVIFYVFAAQERASANYYSDAAKAKQFDITTDYLFDFGIRQVIEGPPMGKDNKPPPFPNSVLSHRRHSLLPNMLGLTPQGQKLDFAPFNGVAFVPTDALYNTINDSDGANPNSIRRPADIANRDPDYTYPDVNNVFLSYDAYEPFGTGYAGGTNDGALGRRRIIIPSFHRPQLASIKGSHGTPWFDSAPANQVLRPHIGHQYVGSRGPTGTSRYMTDAAAQALWGTNVVGFPITPPRDPNLGVPPARTAQRGQQGVWSLSTPPTATTTLAYEYDVDNDGDGEYEGVWLDLGFDPPLEDATGQLYVPMFSFTIKDADALLNLNVHGNMARVWNANVNLDSVLFGGPSNTDAFISKSNQGISASEINPLWAFNRRPPVTGGGIASTDYDGAYGADPFFGGTVGAPAPLNWKEAANRDWLYLLMGRYSTSPSDLVPGRWGEEHLLYRAIVNNSDLKPRYFSVDPSSSLNNPMLLTNPWPGPGQTQYDDNGDRRKVAGDFFGSAYREFGKPLDYTGLGSYWNLSSGKQGEYGVAGPGRWPLFRAYSNRSQVSTVQWPTTGLVNSVEYEGLFNDAGEMVFDADATKDEDAIFGADEMRALHLSNGDFASVTGGQSRLTQLAPYNLTATTATINSASNARNTQEFRSKFTTRSWDRKQHSIGYHSTRTWEFTADADNDGKLEFPPRFGTQTPYSTTDLFRPVLRRLIEVEQNNFDQPRYQLRLNLNQLLVGPNGNPSPSYQPNQYPPNIQLSYRPLTPHPDQTTLGAGVVGPQAPTYPANGNFTSPQQQEYWARRDRQFMARDLFSLMYTLCWPDGIDPVTSTTWGTTAANQAMIRQFAQYAVNLVDSVDRDNIVTKFECDINPNDGWGLNDDPYDNTGDTVANQFYVYGVEQTGLTLSEAAAVRSEEVSSNLSFTEWDDTLADGSHFAYVELSNPGPGTVSFTNRAWRVEVGPDFANRALFPAANDALRRLDLRAGSVTEGTTYTIGSADNPRAASAHPSIMKVGITGSAPGDWDADTTSWIMPAQQQLDLDLKLPAQAMNYVLTNATATAVPTGALYDDVAYQAISAGATASPLYFRLYRRASPDRPFPSSSAEEDDNPYVLVDEIAIHNSTVGANSDTSSTGPRGRVTFASGDTGPDIVAKLANLRSREKAQPFSTVSTNGYEFHTTTGPASPYGNTLADDNGNSPAAFTNWQKVFDRDFASVGELLHVTLGGFSNIIELNEPSSIFTFRAPLSGLATGLDINGVYTTLDSDTDSTATTVATIPSDAEVMFRQIVMPNGGTGLATTAPRWHRLLDIVEVPSRMQAAIPGFPNPVDYPRVTGKINPNTMRHPEVLAALLDDPSVQTIQVDEDFDLNGTLNGSEDATAMSGNGTSGQLDLLHPAKLWRTDNGTATESWWQALVASRDGGRNGSGLAAPDATTGLYLPGTSNSVPFRGFSHAAGTLGSVLGQYATVEHTLLRSWPGDGYPVNDTSTNQPRQMWELGTQNEHRGNDGMGNAVTALDPYVRARLLNKLMNNVTTRSNVFVVFASVKFFRANRLANGTVQIGGPLKAFDNVTNMPTTPPDRTDGGWQPEHRRFYVIDRSQIEKAYDPQSGTFNFRALIEFQQDLPADP